MSTKYGTRNPDGFPIDVLPKLLKNTLFEVEEDIQSPIGLIASSMLSTMAIACQGAFNIRTPINSVLPSSLFIITVAESGERKTATDNIFIQTIRDFEAERRQYHRTKLQSYESKRSVWEFQKKELERSLRFEIREGNGETEPIREHLEELLKNKPVAPLQIRLLYSDSTSEALLENLAFLWPSGAIHSSEASTVMSGRTLHKLGPLNELWDGDSYIPVDRKKSDSFELKDARLSISLMIQLQPFIEFLSKKNGLAINIGLTSRFLVAMPTSTQGFRKIGKIPDTEKSNPTSALSHFKDTLLHWLKISERQTLDGTPLQEFSFDEAAGEAYLEILSRIESAIAPGGEFEEHGAIASKLGNNLARIAGLIQAFENKNNSITYNSLSTASQILYWYTCQHIKFVKNFKNELTDEDMGNMLLEWLRDHPNSCGAPQFRLSQLYKSVSNPIRGKERVLRAVHNLEQRGILIYNRNFSPITVEFSQNLANGFRFNSPPDPFKSDWSQRGEAFLNGILVSKFTTVETQVEPAPAPEEFHSQAMPEAPFFPGSSGV